MLGNAVSTCHIGLLNIPKVASATEKLNFNFYLILNVKGHMWLVAANLGRPAPEFDL